MSDQEDPSRAARDGGPLPEEVRDVDEQYRKRLYRILSETDLSHDEQVRRLLELGCERLDVENGHVVDVEQQTNRHEIVAAVGSDLVEAEAVSELDRTFCRKTIESDQVVTIHDVNSGEWETDPAAEAWDIDCYMGSSLSVDPEFSGTVCFVDREARDESFTASERAFVDLLSQSVSRLLEGQSNEQVLEDERERFSLFVREVSDYAMFLVDPAGFVKSWNTGARNLKGYREDEIVGKHFSELYTEADRERGLPAELLEEARQRGRTVDEGWRLRKDGSTFWARVSITALTDDDGRLRGFGKVTRDLTERRERQRHLEAEQAFTEQALDSLEDIFVVLSPDGEMKRINQRVVDVTGYAESEILSMDPVEFFAPEDRDTIAQTLETVRERGSASAEATLSTESGERLQYEFRVQRLTDQNGDVTGIVGIGRDISRRKLYEQRLEVTQRVLRHNLRNEMTIIHGMAEDIAETGTDEQRTAAARIVKSAERLIDLSEQTRDMMKLDGSGRQAETVCLETVVREIVDQFRDRYPDATIETDLTVAGPLRLSAGESLETALTNAIENAVDHNPASEPWVRVTVEQDSDTVDITVTDDGPGVPAEELAVLEDGEETPLHHGRGLGLWLIYWCVTTVGGQLSFEEHEPSGFQLTLTFPTAEAG